MANALDYFIALSDSRNRNALAAQQVRESEAGIAATQLGSRRQQQLLQQAAELFPGQVTLQNMTIAREQQDAETSELVQQLFSRGMTAARARDADDLEAEKAVDQAFEYLEQQYDVPLTASQRVSAREQFRQIVTMGGDPGQAFAQSVGVLGDDPLAGVNRSLRLAGSRASQAAGQERAGAEQSIGELLQMLAAQPGGTDSVMQLMAGLGLDAPGALQAMPDEDVHALLGQLRMMAPRSAPAAPTGGMVPGADANALEAVLGLQRRSLAEQQSGFGDFGYP